MSDFAPITTDLHAKDRSVIARIRELLALKPEIDIETMLDDALDRKRTQ